MHKILVGTYAQLVYKGLILFALPLMALHTNKCVTHYIYICMQLQVLRNTLACMSHCMVTGYIKTARPMSLMSAHKIKKRSQQDIKNKKHSRQWWCQ